jgi:hypothetical protein
MKGIPLRSGKGEVRRKRKRVSEMVEVRDPREWMDSGGGSRLRGVTETRSAES